MNQQISLDILRNAEAHFLQVQAFPPEQGSMCGNEFFFFLQSRIKMNSFLLSGVFRRDVYCVNKLLMMKCFQNIKYRNS